MHILEEALLEMREEEHHVGPNIHVEDNPTDDAERIQAMLEAMRERTEDPTVQAEGCRALREFAFSADDPENCGRDQLVWRIVEAGVIGELLAQSSSDDYRS